MQQGPILSWTKIRRQVSRDFWLLWPSPVIAHWVSYQQQPSSELGTSLPSNTGPKYGQNYDHKGAVSSTNWHLPRTLPLTENKGICHLPLQRLTPCCLSGWPSATPEGVHGGVRHPVPQGIWWDRPLASWMFLGTDFMISVLASPHT